jgi:hypothetical protein
MAVEYDPYIDSSITKEQLAQLKQDKLIDIIFVRKTCVAKDGTTAGLDPKKCYLYISAEDDFLKGAAEKLKRDFKSVKVADADTTQKMITKIKDEESNSNYGVGMIFGG